MRTRHRGPKLTTSMMSGMTPPRTPIRIIPPVVLFAAIIAMIALDALIPGARLLTWPWRWAGALLIVAGVGLVLVVARLFRRAGTTIMPFEESSALVVEGPYRASRNPIYLGMAIALAGVAILLGTLTPWIVIPLFVIAIDRRFVVGEEAMLRARFGAAYDDYRSRVRRWI